MGGLPTLICGLVDCYCKAPVNYFISSIPLYLRWILGFSDSVSQVCVSSRCAYRVDKSWQNGRWRLLELLPGTRDDMLDAFIYLVLF